MLLSPADGLAPAAGAPSKTMSAFRIVSLGADATAIPGPPLWCMVTWSITTPENPSTVIAGPLVEVMSRSRMT